MCSTHRLSDSSTKLRARFASPSILTSVAIWDTVPSPAPAPSGASPPCPTDHFANVSISVGHDVTVTNCPIFVPLPSSYVATEATWIQGFTRKAFICGTAATFATIRLPQAVSTTTCSRPPSAWAVKICITRLDAAAFLREGALWLQEEQR